MNIIKHGLLAIALFISGHYCLAQKGSLEINGDSYLDSLITKNKERNRVDQTIDGFRIQLFSGNERSNANAVKEKFLKLYPQQGAYMIYNQPYFKIRVGDFRTRLEALELYNKLMAEFGDAIIILPDKINLPKL